MSSCFHVFSSKVSIRQTSMCSLFYVSYFEILNLVCSPAAFSLFCLHCNKIKTTLTLFYCWPLNIFKDKRALKVFYSPFDIKIIRFSQTVPASSEKRILKNIPQGGKEITKKYIYCKAVKAVCFYSVNLSTLIVCTAFLIIKLTFLDSVGVAFHIWDQWSLIIYKAFIVSNKLIKMNISLIWYLQNISCITDQRAVLCMFGKKCMGKRGIWVCHAAGEVALFPFLMFKTY